jgi:thymidylate synthase (FAD)
MSSPSAEALTRVTVPALDEILGKPFQVLDQGFVRVVDYMGGDESVVRAARVAYGKGTKKVSEDEGLIRYLMRHRHTTPFEHAEISLHVKVPMDCWRQWIRHRTANVNEYSTRYSEAKDEAQTTAPNAWRLQSGTNKQGSGETLRGWPETWSRMDAEGVTHTRPPGGMSWIAVGSNQDQPEANQWSRSPGGYLSEREAYLQKELREIYEERLLFGVAREQARKDLPLSTYTEAYWKCDLHNLLHFLGLRMDTHAQLEIRSYANVIGDIVAKWCPMTWAAFKDYRLEALTLSARDAAVVEGITVYGGGEYAKSIARGFGWLYTDGRDGLPKSRERDEFEAKARRLGLSIPWQDWLDS